MDKQYKKVIRTFLELVQIDSPTGDERRMAVEVNNKLNKIGLKASIDKAGNVIASLSGDPLKEVLMLNAHLDTVEPGRGIKPYIDNKGWIRSKGESILGADNKTAVAAILETICRLVEEKSTSHHPLEIIFTVSEESENRGAIALDYTKLKSRLGYSFDVADSNFGDIIVSSPFYNRLDIEIFGKAAHAKSPEKGINVLPIFVNTLSNITLGRNSENTLVNLGIIRAGDVVNSIPGKMTISGEIRSTVERELKSTTQHIINSFKKEAKKKSAKIKFKITRENGGYKIRKDDGFVRHTMQVLNSLGVKPNLVDSFGCADANIFAEHGIKMLSIADASKGAHTRDERIRISDLERLVDLVYLLVKEK